MRSYEVEPEEFGMKRAALEEICGRRCGENAEIIRELLEGKNLLGGMSCC